MRTKANFELAVTSIVEEILAEDKDLVWDVEDSLMPEFEARIRVELTRVQKSSFRDTVSGMLSVGKIDGTYPKLWAAENIKYPIEILREELFKAKEDLKRAKTEARVEKIEIVVEVEKFVGVQLMKGKKVVKKTVGVFHKEFRTILDLVDLRMNIFLFGPTGCGKSHLCEQLADSLGLPFGFVSCTSGMSEGTIGGKLLPVGKGGNFDYVTSEFVRFFENGGVFLLDEIDAADPNVLLFINAALASTTCSVPNRIANPYAKKHENFICIAAANTAGTNADRLYSGRNKLDAATLDRFQVGKITMDYDEDVEKLLCPDEDLLRHCRVIRKSIEDNRLERAMSSRFIRDAYIMMKEKNWTIDKIDRAYFAGWREDEINKVQTDIRRYDNNFSSNNPK